MFEDLAPRVKYEVSALVKSTQKVLVPIDLAACQEFRDEPQLKSTERLSKKGKKLAPEETSTVTIGGDSTDSYCRELQQAENQNQANIMV